LGVIVLTDFRFLIDEEVPLRKESIDSKLDAVSKEKSLVMVETSGVNKFVVCKFLVLDISSRSTSLM
jgi:hypothetical protein